MTDEIAWHHVEIDYSRGMIEWIIVNCEGEFHVGGHKEHLDIVFAREEDAVGFAARFIKTAKGRRK